MIGLRPATARQWGQSLLLGLCCLTSLAVVGWCLIYCGRGYEFTDEGFYLNWLSQPYDYSWSSTQFGFVYRPLSVLLGSDVAALRRANVMLTFGCAFFLSIVFLKTVVFPSGTNRIVIICLAISMAVVSLMQFKIWLPTPNYNSLNLQALMLAATAALVIRARPDWFVGWLLYGSSGALSFLAKPTSAAALASGAGLFLLTARLLRWRGALIASASVLVSLGVAIFLIDGSATAFVERYRSAAEILQAVGSDYTFLRILRIDDFRLTSVEDVVLVTSSFGTAALAWCMISSRIYLEISASVVLATIGFLSIAVLSFPEVVLLRADPAQGLLIIFCFLGVVLLGLSNARRLREERHPADHLWLALFFSFLSYAYVFGTGTNYFESMSASGIFLFMAGLSLLRPAIGKSSQSAAVMPFVIVAQFLVVILLRNAVADPYRQAEPLWNNLYDVKAAERLATIKVSNAIASYIDEAATAASLEGFESAGSLIDMTGKSPGLVYALGARSVGAPWISGGYPGSDQASEKIFRNTSCTDLAIAWLLLEPQGVGTISPSTLQSFGADLIRDYTLAASWKAPIGSSARRDKQEQQLFKPSRNREEAKRACESARAGR